MPVKYIINYSSCVCEHLYATMGTMGL